MTSFSIEELVNETFCEGAVPTGWMAQLSGAGVGEYKQVEDLRIGMESESAIFDVTLTRYADSPDDAIKALFEAMHDAGISL